MADALTIDKTGKTFVRLGATFYDGLMQSSANLSHLNLGLI